MTHPLFGASRVGSVIVIAAGLLLAGVSVSKSRKTAQPWPEFRQPPPAAEVGLRWHVDYDAARDSAQRSGRLLFVFACAGRIDHFTCGAGDSMRRLTLADPRISRWLDVHAIRLSHNHCPEQYPAPWVAPGDTVAALPLNPTDAQRLVLGDGAYNYWCGFASSDGQLLRAFKGFRSPDDFLAEAAIALDRLRELRASDAPAKAGLTSASEKPTDPHFVDIGPYVKGVKNL